MMQYLEDEDMMLFLGSPDLPDLRALSDSGLFLNELCMHDCSRELVLAGSQKSDELKSAIHRVLLPLNIFLLVLQVVFMSLRY